MANGNGQPTQDPSTLPYEGAPSDDEFLKQYGAKPGGPPGTVTAVQPPPPEPGMPATGSGWVDRYGRAAAEGAAFNLPFAGAEAYFGPLGLAGAAATEGLGALGGVEAQGAEDAWRTFHGGEPPWWLGPTAATVGTMGVGGASQWTKAALRSAASHVTGQGLVSGGMGIGGLALIGHDLAGNIVENAGHLIGQLGGPAGLGAGALGVGLGFARNARRALTATPNWRNLKVPIASAVGGAAPQTSDAVNSLMPGAVPGL